MEGQQSSAAQPGISLRSCLSVLNHVAAGVYAVDEVGLCTLINPAALSLLGYSIDECMGHDLHALMHSRKPDGSTYPVEECPLYQARLTGEAVYNLKETFWTRSGAPLRVSCASVPLKDASGTHGTVITLHDLTAVLEAERHVQETKDQQREVLRQRDAVIRTEQEQARLQKEAAASAERRAAEQLREQQRLAEDQLVHSEKLAAVGRLAASITHEINNPLEAVTNLLYLARCDHSVSAEVDTYLQQAEQELGRVSEIVAQTLRFQRGGATAADCLPESLVDSVVALHQGRLHHSNIRIRRQHRRSVPFRCVEGDLRQILNNLVGNAIDSMRKTGGEIVIRTSPGVDSKSGSKGLRISVADTGHGMSRSTASQIFEPFYTTKGASGSGLGLWISHTIAQRHGGTLRVRSCTDEGRRGTTFSLFVPEASAVTLA